MLVVFLTVVSASGGGGGGGGPEWQSEAPSVRGRITGRTTSSGWKVTGIPEAQGSGFWSGCPPPKAHSQRPLCPRKNSRSRWGEHTPSFIGREYLQRQVEEKGSHGVGEIVGTRRTTGYTMAPAPTPTPGRVGEQQGPRKTGWGRTARGGVPGLGGSGACKH